MQKKMILTKTQVLHSALQDWDINLANDVILMTKNDKL